MSDEEKIGSTDGAHAGNGITDGVGPDPDLAQGKDEADESSDDDDDDLVDSDWQDSDPQSGTFEYPDDPFNPDELVTNDAVAGEPVEPTGHYAGPAGSEPLEASPELDEHADNRDDSPTEF